MKALDHSIKLPQFLAGKVARGAALSLTIRIGGLALGFAQAVLFARLLGPAGYGAVAVALSVAALVASLALLGLGGFAVREVSRLRVHAQFGALRGFVGWTTGIVLIAAAIGGGVVAGLTVMPGLALPPELAWGAAIVPAMAVLILLRGVSQGFGRVFDAQAPTELVRPAAMVFALGGAMVLAFPLAVDGAMILLVAAYTVALGLAGLAVLRTLAREVLGGPRTYRRSEWIRGAAPFFAISVLATLQAELNTLLLGWLSGPVEAGLFQPVLRFAPVMVIAIQAVNVPLTPRISELWEQGETERLKHIVRRAAITTTAGAMVTCAALLVLAPWLLSAFGAAFTVNVPALVWLAAAQIFNAACGPVATLLDMTNHQRFTIWGLVASIAANILVGVWLIPQQGAYGAAIAMALSIIVWNVLMLFFVWRKLGFDPSLVGAVRSHAFSR
ncbi:MAG TPA: polysaccharide biosynthesis C-terminal domain-containing protein [Alphaproteobacteria bacterium]|nr:polysaccharide biosynthesis C-terminal domain-containing protein [Alphaproteobacteria bacterium]